MKFSRACTVIIALCCIVMNIPRYFFWKIEHIDWDDSIMYFTMPGPIKTLGQAENIYLWIYFFIAIVLPLVILTFCNLKLLKTLKFASKSNGSIRRHSTKKKSASSHKLTLTLVIIVIVYTVCLVPAEIANFLKHLDVVVNNTKLFNFFVALLNTTQAINFSFNFILYCIVNAQFRRKLVSLLLAPPCFRGLRSGDERAIRNTHVTLKTSLSTELPMEEGTV